MPNRILIDNQCETFTGADREMCLTKLGNIRKNQFSIHGLWPSNTSGTYLPWCNDGTNITAADIAADSTNKPELYSNMSTYWTSYKESDADFWIHEYNKHGHCYNMRYNKTQFSDYFAFTVNHFISNALGEIFLKAFYKSANSLIDIHKAELDVILQSLYPGIQYKLICRSKDQRILLSEIYIIYDVDFGFLNTTYTHTDASCGSADDYISILFK